MRRFLSLIGMALLAMACHAQIDTRDLRRSFESFRQEIHADYDDFREQITQEFISFLKNPWKEFEATKSVPLPKEKVVPPPVIHEENKNSPIKSHPVIVDDTVQIVPVAPQPTPVVPIEEVPLIDDSVSVSFFGKNVKVRYDQTQRIKLNTLNENEVAKAMKVLATETYDNVIYDCLEIRERLQLCDWAYLLLVKSVADELYGTRTNEAALLCAYVYAVSGYKMRLATDGARLYMLFACRHSIYERPSYLIDNENFYCLEDLPHQLRISEASYRNEQSLSLLITKPQRFATAMSEERIITSRDYADMRIRSKVNKNLVDFCQTYPSSYYNDDFMTRWAIYANKPIANDVKQSLYPALLRHVSGKSQYEATNRLLNWVQTGFVYEYDDKVWGQDRAFFAEETLFYPYCDCEDRSIFFSRLVRDLLGLDVVLVYYPGHLATAVKFTEDVSGDYMMLNNQRFVICDPTYIGASVGRSMPNLETDHAKVILLE